jgi:hypothetical protein
MTSTNGHGNPAEHVPPGDQPTGRPLRTEPRPFMMHVAVDSVIAFCATVFLLWLFGVPLWVMIIVSWVLGLCAAPFTRRWEQQQLDERKPTTP